jgi:molybdopterin/thiamine biosynthesis adenylyltransferase
VDYEVITQYLVDKGYQAKFEELDGTSYLFIAIEIGDSRVELVHFPTNEFSALPVFWLRNASTYGTLAHVLSIDEIGYGHICIGDRDSISVNFEQPHLAMEASLRRHIDLIKRAIEDPEWNQQELVREFISNWSALLNESDPQLILAAAEKRLELMRVFNPKKSSGFGYASFYLGITEHISELSEFSNIAPTNTNGRSPAGEGYVVPLGILSSPPRTRDELANWYVSAISSLTPEKLITFEKLVSRRRSSRFWIVFNGNTTSGTAWFGVHISPKGKGKKTLPLTTINLREWSIKPIRVTVFNKEQILPRGGANTSLSDKSVLVVGCGSVGGEIAFRLASSGVGKLVFVDPDFYSLDNLYRHALDERLIGAGKALGLTLRIESKHPWTKCIPLNKKLLDLRSKSFLKDFDLMIIAIGSPTHERLFHDFITESRVSLPVINTWVEGYGIGGHATLDIPRSKGCLHCAYIDHSDLSRGLASNLNFLEPNQDVTVNHAGCGSLFLPYSTLNAGQTALAASDLAINYLSGLISESCKVSWKGDDTEALKAGLKTTHRYQVFQKSLVRLPLYDEHCDLCNHD